jgi:hypothetical protein
MKRKGWLPILKKGGDKEVKPRLAQKRKPVETQVVNLSANQQRCVHPVTKLTLSFIGLVAKNSNHQLVVL